MNSILNVLWRQMNSIFLSFLLKKKRTESKFIRNISSIIQVGSLAALHLAKKGHDIHLYEYREGNFSQNTELMIIIPLSQENQFFFHHRHFSNQN